MTVPRFFRLNSNNALIEFLLEVRRSLFPWWWEINDILWPRLLISRPIKTGGNCHLLFQGTPEIREHYLDSKKDVDRHLKAACEQFIQQQSKLFVEPLEEFLTKVRRGWRLSGRVIPSPPRPSLWMTLLGKLWQTELVSPRLAESVSEDPVSPIVDASWLHFEGRLQSLPIFRESVQTPQSESSQTSGWLCFLYPQCS